MLEDISFDLQARICVQTPPLVRGQLVLAIPDFVSAEASRTIELCTCKVSFGETLDGCIKLIDSAKFDASRMVIFRL